MAETTDPETTDPETPTLDSLADALAAQGAKQQRKIARERAELTMRGKLRPTKEQDAPRGLFEQEQHLV